MTILSEDQQKLQEVMQKAMLAALIELGDDVDKLDIFSDNPYPEK